jgi:hypothetical protein
MESQAIVLDTQPTDEPNDAPDSVIAQIVSTSSHPMLTMVREPVYSAADVASEKMADRANAAIHLQQYLHITCIPSMFSLLAEVQSPFSSTYERDTESNFVTAHT